mmetsp:Transcript_25079/g.55188  ORF Transcript_25079/g.55188 Transcript_25079/m.55188 type:complete len:467 (-) Transcript_25079:492-1892(-)
MLWVSLLHLGLGHHHHHARIPHLRGHESLRAHALLRHPHHHVPTELAHAHLRPHSHGHARSQNISVRLPNSLLPVGRGRGHSCVLLCHFEPIPDNLVQRHAAQPVRAHGGEFGRCNFWLLRQAAASASAERLCLRPSLNLAEGRRVRPFAATFVLRAFGKVCRWPERLRGPERLPTCSAGRGLAGGCRITIHFLFDIRFLSANLRERLLELLLQRAATIHVRRSGLLAGLKIDPAGTSTLVQLRQSWLEVQCVDTLHLLFHRSVGHRAMHVGDHASSHTMLLLHLRKTTVNVAQLHEVLTRQGSWATSASWVLHILRSSRTIFTVVACGLQIQSVKPKPSRLLYPRIWGLGWRQALHEIGCLLCQAGLGTLAFALVAASPQHGRVESLLVLSLTALNLPALVGGALDLSGNSVGLTSLIGRYSALVQLCAVDVRAVGGRHPEFGVVYCKLIPRPSPTGAKIQIRSR